MSADLLTVQHGVELYNQLTAIIDARGRNAAFEWVLEQEPRVVALALVLLAND